MSDFDVLNAGVDALLAGEHEIDNPEDASYTMVFAGILRLVLQHMIELPQGSTIHVFLRGENVVVGVQPTLLPVPPHVETMPDDDVARVNALMAFLTGVERGIW